MTRKPIKGDIIYFPGFGNIGPLASKVEKTGANEEGFIVYINNILPKVKGKMRMGDKGDWVDETSTIYRQSFIIGEEIHPGHVFEKWEFE